MLYRVYGLAVASDREWPGLPPAADAEPDVRVRYEMSPQLFCSPSRWFTHWRFGWGTPCAKLDGGYLLRFPAWADFFITDDGQEIICFPAPELARNTLRYLLWDCVIPLVIGLKGGEVLHASAVLMAKGGIAFIGAPGAGKSSLAGHFLRAGALFLSDDFSALVAQDRGIYIMPAPPDLRLWGDSLLWLFGEEGASEPVTPDTSKRRVPVGMTAGAYRGEPAPLIRIYAIADPAEANGTTGISIEPISPRESLMVLVSNTLRLDITDRETLAREFFFFQQIVSTVPVRRLHFSRDFHLLPAVREAILADLTENVP
jgi:hypothetical protein